jgi:Bifunctional DNA primase/polymerase, N-terminal
MADSPNLRAALAYAKAGWRVFPCVPGEKVPATSNGVKDATSDERQIREWWGRNPDRNVAIACGYPGPDVLDIDRKPDGSGFPALRMLRAVGLIPQPRAMIRTPNDGAHLYFAPTPGAGNGSVRSAHIDHRGEGGYVVAPPSEVRRAADGQRRPYIVVHHQASTDRISWAQIRERLEPAREHTWAPPAHLRNGGQQNLDHLVQHMAGLSDGRKTYLFWAANRMLDHGQEDRLPELAAAARAAGSDPRQIERTIDSAREQQRQDPQAGQQPRGAVRLAGPRALEPAAVPPPRRPAERQEEPRRPVAVLEVDRDGPRVGPGCTLADPCHGESCDACYPERAMQAEARRADDAAQETARSALEAGRDEPEHPAAGARERALGRQADAEPEAPSAEEPEPEAEAAEPEPEPGPQEASPPPFAQPEPDPETEPEREAGE